jgi:hypothetical protein
MRSLVTPSVLLALAACALPPAPPPAIPIAPPPSAAPSADPTAPMPDPSVVSVTAVERPAKLVIDGDVSEWGSLLPPPPDPKEKRDPKKPDPNPRDASSHVAIAFTAEGVHVAAELGEGMREGLWLGLGVEPPPTLPVGEYQRGGGVLPFMECQRTPDMPEDAPDPETTEACKRVMKSAADKVAAHEARFRTLFRLDREGVRAVDEAGAKAAVAGAQIAIKAAAKGATLEAFLPLRALPRMSEAPIPYLQVLARALSVAAKDLPKPEAWPSAPLPRPLGIEPWAALRAAVYDSERGFYPAGLSYHPAEPTRIESLRYPGEFVTRDYEVRDGLLYTSKVTLGDVQVGLVQSRGDSVAVLKKGEVVEVHRPWDAREFRERDGEIHVLGYRSVTWTDSWTTTAGWSVLAIGADGAARDGEQVVERPQLFVNWESPQEFHSADYATVGVRGGAQVQGEQKVVGWEVTWRWNKAKRIYAVTERGIALPPKAKKKRR